MAPRVATEADLEGLTSTLTRAFEHDPLWRWAFPEPGGFRRIGEFSTPDGAHTVATMWREASP